jgi:hypothetical protein
VGGHQIDQGKRRTYLGHRETVHHGRHKGNVEVEKNLSEWNKKDSPKPITKANWKPSEQAALDALKETDVGLESTALGAAAKKMVNNLKNSMGSLDDTTLKELEAILQARNDHKNPNAL